MTMGESLYKVDLSLPPEVTKGSNNYQSSSSDQITNKEQSSRGVRATGHKTPGESSVNITVSVYDTTHLQENPQRIG